MSGRTATGEVWSGFAADASGPSLIGGQPATGGTGAASPAGLVLFALGVAILAGTAGTALVHQRRLQRA